MVLRLLSLWVAVFWLLSCSSNSKTAPKEEQNAQLPIAGERIFELNCAVCHGIEGKGGNADAKDLTKSKLSTLEVEKRIKYGKNGMPPILDVAASKQLTDSVVAYVKSLRN